MKQNPTRILQSQDELKNHLAEHVAFIQSSSMNFDNGFPAEAKRLATSLRALLHDTRNSKSILLQLDEKDKIEFWNSSSQFIPENLMPYTGLVSMNIVNDSDGFRVHYKPLLNNSSKKTTSKDWQEFNEWWNGIILKDQQGNIFTRKGLILHVANTDGGAHVDALDAAYASLSRNNSIGFTVVLKNAGKAEEIDSIKDIELSSVRQIAFEVIKSLEKSNLLK